MATVPDVRRAGDPFSYIDRVPLLVVINGVPASGKSTLARRYAVEHPMTLALDIDVIRSMIGGWSADPTASGLAARAIALAMIRVHVEAGHHVVVPQYLGRVDFLLALEKLATEVGATLVEVVLTGDAAAFAARFVRRSERDERPEHHDAADLLDRAGGPQTIAAAHDRLLAMVAGRPRTIHLTSAENDEDRTYRALRTVLERAAGDRPTSDIHHRL